MPRTFVDALADSIVRQLLQAGQADGSVASPHGAGRSLLADLEPHGIERVASAIAGHLAGPNTRNELPLEAIEI